MKRFLMVLSTLALSACGSPPAYNYTLSPSVLSQASALVTAKTGPYSLAEVTVPAEADHTSLVIQQADGRVLMLADDLWTAPLSAHLQTALSLELTTLLGMPPVQNLSSGVRDESEVTRIQVDVQRFDLVPGKFVAIQAQWRIRFAGKPSKMLTCFTSLQQPVGVGVSALVTGQQANTQKLSALIAQSLIQRASPANAQCTSNM